MSSSSLSEEEKQHIADFRRDINMTVKQLTDWLKTDESRSVGQKTSENAESTGHESGRHIIKLLDKKQSEYTADDVHEMRRIVGYIHRHMAQRPSGDVTDTPWRYSLMNWGHDPLKK